MTDSTDTETANPETAAPKTADGVTDLPDRLADAGAVAILRLREHARTLAVGRALIAGGITVMELTLDDPGAADALGTLVAELGEQALIGAGTVTSVEQVRQAAKLGARFCVSPNTDPAVIRAALDAGLEALPGAATPTEVGEGLKAGARLIKLFPAGALGIGYLRALRGPFGGVSFVPTGGIKYGEVADWLSAGALAVGLGSDLVPARPTEDDLATITRKAADVTAAINPVS
jgi:Entner-Doudoroff aldolase